MKLPTQAFVDALEKVRQHLPDMDYRPDTLVNMRILRKLNLCGSNYLNQILAEHQLNDSMFYALVMLYRCEGGAMQPSELSDILDLTRTSATRLSDDLVGHGWVIRRASSQDRRSVLLSLSQNGIKLVEEITPKLVNARLTLWQDFSDEEVVQMQSLLNKLLARIELESKS